MKITIYPDKCVGVGQCVVAAPSLFAQNDDDGQVIQLKQKPDAAEYQAARAAVRLCPASALAIEEE